MKLILGDNQFFGINHNNFSKGISDKEKFTSDDDIKAFINESLKVGLDGFMINSNIIGYRLLSRNKFPVNKEIHYSIPYPHKYAAIVNESGMISLLSYFLKNSSIWITIKCASKFLLSRNLKYLLPVATSLEIPKNLPKNSVIYLQNILTDLIIGIGRIDILEYYIKEITKMGYRAGLITLNLCNHSCLSGEI